MAKVFNHKTKSSKLIMAVMLSSVSLTSINLYAQNKSGGMMDHSKMDHSMMMGGDDKGKSPTDKMKGGENKNENKEINTRGKVEKIEKNRVVITHEKIDELKWPTMTMAFEVKDPKVLESMREGKEIEFSMEKKENSASYWITKVKESKK